MNTNNKPSVTFYHANAKGTGCAAQFSLRPANDEAEGCVMMQLANQLTLGDRRGATPVYPRFDWENTIDVKLDFGDLCKMMQVFRGEEEEIDYGKGLYHVSKTHATKIILRHIIEPDRGYSLEVYRNACDGKDENRAHILFNQSEAFGLYEAFSGSMSRICFG